MKVLCRNGVSLSLVPIHLEHNETLRAEDGASEDDGVITIQYGSLIVQKALDFSTSSECTITQNAQEAIALLDVAMFLRNSLLERACIDYLIQVWQLLDPFLTESHIRDHLLEFIPGPEAMSFIQTFYEEEHWVKMEQYYVQHRYGLPEYRAENGLKDRIASKLLKTEEQRCSNDYISDVFLKLCRKGFLKSLQWLSSRIQLTLIIERWRIIEAFFAAVVHGQLPVLQWMTHQFRLTAREAKKECNFAFRQAAWYGHLDVLQWLVSCFSITGEDVNDYALGYAMDFARENRHTSIVEWLTERFPQN